MSMQVSIIMNLINIGGNALLIYGLRRGTEGVAIPTLVSRLVAAVIITARLCDERLPLHIKRTFRYRIDWPMVRRILGIGVPNGLENSMFQLGKILVLSLVSTFGTYAIAANAVSNIIAQFQIIPGLALSLAMTTVIARCVGAGDYEQVRYYIKKLMTISAIIQAGVVAFTLVILPWILRIYNLSDITAESVTKIIWFHGLCSLVIWPISFVLPCAFRAAGDAKVCMLISSLSMWIFRIAFSYLLGRNMGMGVFGVWVAMVVDWIFRAICFVIRYVQGGWKKNAIL
jgi:putative MATE family efflux protein